MAESVLSAENICKAFGANEVLRGISFQVHQGEVLSVIGPSGSGKSTLLRCSTLLEKVDSGRIAYGDLLMVEGEKGGKAQYSPAPVLQQIRRRFGLVFQNFNLFPHFSVLRNITEAQIRVAKRSQEEAVATARSLLDKVGLRNKENAYPCELSGGQQQRVAIARALISRPEILFADEPTGNLDTKTGEEIMALLQEINQTNGQTILMVTHSPDAAKSSSRIITVRDGIIC